MEITLEMIEQVKDKTGVTYKEAKEALDANNGSVIDAIIALEEVNEKEETGKAGELANDLYAKVKEIVKKGNVSRIVVKKGENTLLNLPLNVGIVGGILVGPTALIVGVVAAYGFNCEITFYNTDGSSINLSEKAGKYVEKAKEKGEDIYDTVMDQAPDKFYDLKDKGTDLYYDLKDKGLDVFEDVKDKGLDVFEQVKEKAPDYVDLAKGYAETAKDYASNLAEDAMEKAEDLAEVAKEKGEEIFKTVKTKKSDDILDSFVEKQNEEDN